MRLSLSLGSDVWRRFPLPQQEGSSGLCCWSAQVPALWTHWCLQRCLRAEPPHRRCHHHHAPVPARPRLCIRGSEAGARIPARLTFCCSPFRSRCGPLGIYRCLPPLPAPSLAAPFRTSPGSSELACWPLGLGGRGAVVTSSAEQVLIRPQEAAKSCLSLSGSDLRSYWATRSPTWVPITTGVGLLAMWKQLLLTPKKKL